MKRLFIYFRIAFWLTSCESTLLTNPPEQEPFLSFAGLDYAIYLPPNYDEEKVYPLLIMNDGATMLSKAWQSRTRFDSWINDSEIEPFIAVAIEPKANRNNWYIPYVDGWILQNWGTYSPKAKEYSETIIHKLIPELKSQYSIDTARVGIIGFSLGGLHATWMGLKYPQHISFSASLSGSFWVADYAIFNEVQSSYPDENKFWFDIGTGEWNYYVPLYQELDRVKVAPGERSFYYEIQDGAHTQVDWISRLHMPLKVFLGIGNPTLASFEVEYYCIPSQSVRGRSFRRMNPLITRDDGVKYSLAHRATYTLLEGSAELGSEGSFRNDPTTQVSIAVNYQSFADTVKIPLGWCP